MSPYVGVSKSYLANFNSENAQAGIGAPDSALQYEAGIKFSFLDDRIVLNRLCSMYRGTTSHRPTWPTSGQLTIFRLGAFRGFTLEQA
jgi:hypothetical protein